MVKVIGVLAIQGAVSEHVACIEKLGYSCRQIRRADEFAEIDGLILPGGESTTMAIVCEESGLFPALRKWVHDKRPTYGTCAGMILLSDHAIKTADGGQSLLGGLDVHVCRNYFGSQIYSTKVDIEAAGQATTFPAVFIRAPAILQVGPEVQVLAKMTAAPHKSARKDVLNLLGLDPNELAETFEVNVAVRQHNILATAFHPELTSDLRWHQMFLDMVEEASS